MRRLGAAGSVAALLALVAPGAAGAATPGEALYALGARPGAASPRATTAGGAVLPATALPCAGCHGADGGGGRAEAGVRPPPIAWSALSRATAERPAYDEATLLRAVATGQAAGVRALDAAMPRYTLTLEDGQALLAWLRALDARTVPGVEENRVRLGLLLPAGPRGAAFETAFRAAVVAAAPAGVFGRDLDIRPAVVAEPAEAGEATRRLLAEGLLLLVSALPEDGTAAALDATRHDRAPVLALRAGTEPAPLAYALLPGAIEEGLALLRAIPDPGRALLAIGEGGAAERRLAERIVERIEAGTGAEPRIVGLSDLAQEALDASAVLLLTPAPDAAVATALRDTALPVLLPGSLGGVAAPAVAAALGRTVLVAFGVPPGGGGGGAAATRFAAGDAARWGLTGRLGHAAGEVVVEALRRAGRGVTRERALAALGGGEPFETGSLPPLHLLGGARGGGVGGAIWMVQVDGEGRAVRRGAPDIARAE